MALRIISLLALLGLSPCHALEKRQELYFLQFSAEDTKSLGQIDKLTVAVTCSWVSVIKHFPELYNMEIEYDIPAVQVLEARPRLGAAAVDLSHWSEVIGVHLPKDPDGLSCFNVSVTAEGRTGITRHWTSRQLGFPQ